MDRSSRWLRSSWYPAWRIAEVAGARPSELDGRVERWGASPESHPIDDRIAFSDNPCKHGRGQSVPIPQVAHYQRRGSHERRGKLRVQVP